MVTRTYGCSERKFYKVIGKLIIGCFFKTITPFEGIVMVSGGKYAFEAIEEKKSPTSSIIVDNYGDVLINRRFELSAVALASDEDIQHFTTSLKAKNFVVELDEKTTRWELKFKNPKKVKFLVRDKIVDRRYIENMELEPNVSIVDYYDNGYSYMSSDPITKEKFLEVADKMTNMPFRWECNGIHFVKKNGEYCIHCMLGENKHYSEISNT